MNYDPPSPTFKNRRVVNNNINNSSISSSRSTSATPPITTTITTTNHHHHHHLNDDDELFPIGVLEVVPPTTNTATTTATATAKLPLYLPINVLLPPPTGTATITTRTTPTNHRNHSNNNNNNNNIMIEEEIMYGTTPTTPTETTTTLIHEGVTTVPFDQNIIERNMFFRNGTNDYNYYDQYHNNNNYNSNNNNNYNGNRGQQENNDGLWITTDSGGGTTTNERRTTGGRFSQQQQQQQQQQHSVIPISPHMVNNNNNPLQNHNHIIQDRTFYNNNNNHHHYHYPNIVVNDGEDNGFIGGNDGNGDNNVVVHDEDSTSEHSRSVTSIGHSTAVTNVTTGTSYYHSQKHHQQQYRLQQQLLFELRDPAYLLEMLEEMVPKIILEQYQYQQQGNHHHHHNGGHNSTTIDDNMNNTTTNTTTTTPKNRILHRDQTEWVWERIRKWLWANPAAGSNPNYDSMSTIAPSVITSAGGTTTILGGVEIPISTTTTTHHTQDPSSAVPGTIPFVVHNNNTTTSTTNNNNNNNNNADDTNSFASFLGNQSHSNFTTATGVSTTTSCWNHPSIYETRSIGLYARGTNEMSPLHYVCKLPYPPFDIISAFVESAPDTVSWCDQHGWLPLHHVCANGCESNVLRLLIDCYPLGKINRDQQHRTPLHFYATRSSSMDKNNITIMNTNATLLCEPIQVPVTLNNSSNQQSSSQSQNHDDNNANATNTTTTTLITAAQLPDVNGMLPFHYGCAYGTSVVVLKALAHAYPKSLTYKEHHGRTPMHLAMVNAYREESYNVIQFLLSSSSSYHHTHFQASSRETINSRDEQGYLPLHLLAAGLKQRLATVVSTKNHSSSSSGLSSSSRHGRSGMGGGASSGAATTSTSGGSSGAFFDDTKKRTMIADCLTLYLEAEPHASVDFLSAIQDLPVWLQETAVVTKHVRNILNKKISQRFPTMILMLDGSTLLLLVIGFALTTHNHIDLRYEPDTTTNTTFGWLMIVLYCATYFLIREIVQFISLVTLNRNVLRQWFQNLSTWLFIIVIVLVYTYGIEMLLASIQEKTRTVITVTTTNNATLSTFGTGGGDGNSSSSNPLVPYSYSVYLSSHDGFRTGVGITQGILWIAVLVHLKKTLVAFAVFVGGVFYVVRRLFAFLIGVGVILLAFAQMFYFIYVGTDICKYEEENNNNNNNTNNTTLDDTDYDYNVSNTCSFPHCRFDTSFLKVYTMMMGEIGIMEYKYQSSLVGQILYVAYGLLIVLLLSNLLIAIVQDSYEIIQNERAAIVFWSNRLDYVAEMDGIVHALQRRLGCCYYCYQFGGTGNNTIGETTSGDAYGNQQKKQHARNKTRNTTTWNQRNDGDPTDHNDITESSRQPGGEETTIIQWGNNRNGAGDGGQQQQLQMGRVRIPSSNLALISEVETSIVPPPSQQSTPSNHPSATNDRRGGGGGPATTTTTGATPNQNRHATSAAAAAAVTSRFTHQHHQEQPHLGPLDTTSPPTDHFRDIWQHLMNLLFDDDGTYHTYDPMDWTDRWVYHICRFIAVIFVLPLWLLCGFMTAGLLWPPQVREYLFVQKDTLVSQADLERQKLKQIQLVHDDLMDVKHHIIKEMERDRDEMIRYKMEVDSIQSEIYADLVQIKELMDTLLGTNNQ